MFIHFLNLLIQVQTSSRQRGKLQLDCKHYVLILFDGKLSHAKRTMIIISVYTYKCVFTCNVFTAQLKQTEGQSEAAKQKELQRKIDQLKAEISQLDSQISGTEEHLATQGMSSTLCKVHSKA